MIGARGVALWKLIAWACTSHYISFRQPLSARQSQTAQRLTGTVLKTDGYLPLKIPDFARIS
jgi:hypothetical protein